MESHSCAPRKTDLNPKRLISHKCLIYRSGIFSDDERLTRGCLISTLGSFARDMSGR